MSQSEGFILRDEIILSHPNWSAEGMSEWKIYSELDLMMMISHLTMSFAGFRLVAIGDSPASLQSPRPVEEPSQQQDNEVPNPFASLPLTWNHPHLSSHICLQYRHRKSSMVYVIKGISMGIMGSTAGGGSSTTAHAVLLGCILDTLHQENPLGSSIPPSTGSKYIQTLVDWKLLKGCPFQCPLTFPEFLRRIKDNELDADNKAIIDHWVLKVRQRVIDRLVPGLCPGYSTAEEVAYSGSGIDRASRTDETAGPSIERDISPRATQPQRPWQPPINPSFGIPDPQNPFNIGRSDLDPFSALTQPSSSGGGMIVGPDHPIFDVTDPSMPSTSGLPGPQNLPPGAVPEGARFDPISPFDTRGPLARGRGRGRGTRGRGSTFRSGEPDFDHLQPPGYPDMFG